MITSRKLWLDLSSKAYEDPKHWISCNATFHNIVGVFVHLIGAFVTLTFTTHDGSVEVDEVKEAVQNELEGPGKLLGYRAMHKKVRLEHGLNVTRDQVYDVMYDLDPQGLAARDIVGAKRQRKKGNFTTRGSNWVHSLDGHDKLMGYQNSTFPLAIYGCMDTASRKLLWLRVWLSNHDPKLIGKWYLEHLYETRVLSAMLRVDKGTETGTMSTMHAFLRRHHNDMDPHETVIYGPSTSNQVRYFI